MFVKARSLLLGVVGVVATVAKIMGKVIKVKWPAVAGPHGPASPAKKSRKSTGAKKNKKINNRETSASSYSSAFVDMSSRPLRDKKKDLEALEPRITGRGATLDMDDVACDCLIYFATGIAGNRSIVELSRDKEAESRERHTSVATVVCKGHTSLYINNSCLEAQCALINSTIELVLVPDTSGASHAINTHIW